ncbi:formylglycine-generating enzyme family protein, partial [Chloroflexota bacterium]
TLWRWAMVVGEQTLPVAARGVDGRIYPWGNDWHPLRCSSRQGGPGLTTPVGQYSPTGDSPYGCADMAGNVWEWCHSLYRDYPYRDDDGREDSEAEGDRVLRGGSTGSHQRDVRCAFRSSLNPSSRHGNFGFRVVVTPV